MYAEDDLLAMWVADMDFAAPACVTDALHAYVSQGVFGYYRVPDSYYQAFIDWEKEHHQYEVKKEWIRFSPGVVAAFYWIVQFMTKPLDAVLVNTPVYYPFMNAVRDGGRTLITSELACREGNYQIDFEDFEKKIVEHRVSLFILCSPHNPVGRVWKEEELARMLKICRKHQVYVISDEIHRDIVFGDHVHMPTLKVGNYDDIHAFMEETCKLAFDYGDWFGDEAYASFIRMNLATSRENVASALNRIISNLK